MAWVSDSGMNSQVRLRNDALGILDDWCNVQEGKETEQKVLQVCRLGEFVEAQCLRLPRVDFLGFMYSLYDRIGRMLNSGGHQQTKAGIQAVSELISMNLMGEDASKCRKLSEILASALRHISSGVLHNATEEQQKVIHVICMGYGKLVGIGGPVAAGIASEQMEISLHGIGADKITCFTAFSILSEIAQNAPAQFNNHIEKFLQRIPTGVFHADPGVQHATLRSLKAATLLRNVHRCENWFSSFTKTCLEVAMSKDESSSEVLKALRGLITALEAMSGMLSNWFDEVGQLLRSLWDGEDSDIQMEAVRLVPVLAKLNPNAFEQSLLDNCLEQLMEHVSNEVFEAAGFEALTNLVSIYERGCDETGAQEVYSLTKWLPNFAAAVQKVISDENMSSEIKGKAIEFCSSLCGFLPGPWRFHALQLTRISVKEGLSPQLMDLIQMVVDLYPDAHEILGNDVLQTVRSTLKSAGNNKGGLDVVLALELVAAHHIPIDNEFLKIFHGQLHTYLYDMDHEDVRLAGFRACMALIRVCMPVTADHQISRDQALLLESMLEHISTVAVMDVSNSIRIEVVQKLLNQQDLFSHLAQDRISSRLALGLYDNFRPAQGLFIQLLCNLSHLHHGWVMPALRSLHMNVLVDLQSSCDSATAGKTVAGSAHILSLIVQKAPQFIMTNGTKVLESVVSRLDQYVLNEKPCSSVKDPAVHAVDELLNCLWAWGESLAGYSSKIGPILEAVILDEANKDRQILAAQILEKVIKDVGEIILPFIHVDDIILALCHVMWKSLEAECQIVMRLLDAFVGSRLVTLEHSLKLLDLACHQDLPSMEGRDVEFFSSLFKLTNEHGMEEHYTSIVINTLIRAFKDPEGRADSSPIFKCLMAVFTTIENASGQHLERVIPFILQAVWETDEELRLLLFEHMWKLAEIIGSSLAPFSSEILDVCIAFWGSSMKLTKQILMLLARLYHMLEPKEVKDHMKKVIPKVAALLSESQRSGDYYLVIPAFTVLDACQHQISPFLPLLLPVMSQFIQDPGPPGGPVPVNVKKECLHTLTKVLKAAQLSKHEHHLYAGQTVLSLVRLFEREPELKDDAARAVTSIAHVLRPGIAGCFDRRVQQIMSSSISDTYQMEKQAQPISCPQNVESTEYLGNNVRPEPDGHVEDVSNSKGVEQACSHINGTAGNGYLGSETEHFKVNVAELSQAWDSRECNSREDWAEWMRGLSEELLKQSPSAVLRECHGLAQVNASFNRRLFPASLMSCWSALKKHQRMQLQKPIWKAITVRDTSSEVVEYILNLECLVNLELGKASLPGLDSLRLFAEQCVTKAKSQNIPQRHY